jgi:hypothetical protein
LKELDLNEPLYSSNFAYDNSNFGHFWLNSFVPEIQSLRFKNIKILWGITADLPISLQIRNAIMAALNYMQMFCKRPLIYINSKVPFDESLPPLPSRRSGVPDDSVMKA